MARGNRPPLIDESVQNTTLVPPLAAMNNPQGDWNKIQGELITFANPELDLPPIDRLEGFTHGGWCLYERVLMPVAIGSTAKPAWLYRYNQPHEGKWITSGTWHASIPISANAVKNFSVCSG